MWRQMLKGIGFFLLIVAVVTLSVWAVMSFLDKHFGVNLGLSPIGYFDAEDVDIRSCAGNVCVNPERSEGVSEAACGQLDSTAQHECSMSRKIARLEEEPHTLRGGCDPPRVEEARIAQVP